MRDRTKATIFFVFSLIIILLGSLPLLRESGVTFLEMIPSEGTGYAITLMVIGLVGVIVSISRDRSYF